MNLLSPRKLMTLKVMEFLDDLDEILGDIRDYIVFKQSIKLMSSLNEDTVQRSFDEYVCTPYKEYIVRKDEMFFIQSADSFESSASEFDLVRIIKSKWMSLSENNKQAIWNHLNLLIILNERCNKC